MRCRRRFCTPGAAAAPRSSQEASGPPRYGYAFRGDTFRAMRLTSQLLKDRFNVAVATEPFTLKSGRVRARHGDRRSERNTEALHARLNELAKDARRARAPRERARRQRQRSRRRPDRRAAPPAHRRRQRRADGRPLLTERRGSPRTTPRPAVHCARGGSDPQRRPGPLQRRSFSLTAPRPNTTRTSSARPESRSCAAGRRTAARSSCSREPPRLERGRASGGPLPR